MQKGQTLIFLLIGILIIAGGAFYLGKSSTPKPSPGPVVTAQPVSQSTPVPSSIPDTSPTPAGLLDTANWKTYKSNAFKFSVKYPNNWQILEPKKFPDSIEFYPPEADMNLIVKVDNGQRTPDEGMKTLQWQTMGISISTHLFKESPLGNKDPLITNWKLVTIDGIEGHYYVTHLCAPKCSVNVDLPWESGQKTLQIWMSSDGDTNIFDSFYPTIKFLK